jgi:putative DNA methylase
MTQRAIEESFPIIEINRLAVPERNAFKPIYQMHKWFARRASCVFRAILLGCLKPAGADIMQEFYKDHTHDLDTNGQVILDPFMGGGTTVVEALRLGCRVIGIDLNPVAWFIVKTEVEPVDVGELRAAFDRLADRIVPWSGKSVRETLLEQYKTDCSCCALASSPSPAGGRGEADIIYTFWVKSAICHNPTCPARSGDQGPEVPLFSDYVIARRSPSVRYWRDVTCRKCHKKFDWEVEPATLVAEPALCVNAPRSGGLGRSSSRWAFSASDAVECPWCRQVVQPIPPQPKAGGKQAIVRKERKKVPLTVLLCPNCQAVWQYRGDLPDQVACPVCRHAYDPLHGNMPDKGKFVCPHCGSKDDIIASIRRLPHDRLLPIRPYALQCRCSRCGGQDDDLESTTLVSDLFSQPALSTSSQSTDISPSPTEKMGRRVGIPDRPCPLAWNGGKFFKRVSVADLARYQQAVTTWEREKNSLPHPKQEIPEGYNTNQMIKHHYHYWHQMFNPRQLLCLSSLLKAINEESEQMLKEMLLTTFQTLLDRNNMFCRYFNDRDTVQGSFSRHDFQPKLTPAETNIWGSAEWRGTMPNLHLRTLEGIEYGYRPYDNVVGTKGREKLASSETIYGKSASLYCDDSATSPHITALQADYVITDPPYAGNVNYAELSDFFYVWLRLILASTYPQFTPDETPKLSEVIENPNRGKTASDFRQGLTAVFRTSHKAMRVGGLLIFTFHHAEGRAWESVLQAVCDAGFEISATYPVHGEKESSLMLQATQGISYDLIHVCRKRTPVAVVERRSWAGIRQETRRRAREEIRAIEAGRYGNEPLAPSDVNIILIGKCLELYSRHYGAVIDHEGSEVPLHDALIEIRSMVDQFVQKEQPLPSELEDVDAESRVYLLTLASQKEIKSDDVHKATRGILEPDDLLRAGLIIKGRARRGRTFEVKQPVERLSDLLATYQPEQERAVQMSLFGDPLPPRTKHKALFIDQVHLLLGLAESGENLMPWLERFQGDRPRLRAACEYLTTKNKSLAGACQKVLRLMEPGPLFKGAE